MANELDGKTSTLVEFFKQYSGCVYHISQNKTGSIIRVDIELDGKIIASQTYKVDGNYTRVYS